MSHRLLRTRVPLEVSLEAAVRRALQPLGKGAREGRTRQAWKRLEQRWSHTLASLRPLGGISHDNAIEIFCDGDRLFEAQWKAFAEAQRSILFSTYIFEPDRVGLRTLDGLARAAERGVAVHLRFDSVGSSDLEEEHLEELRRLGAKVEEYNPFFRWHSRFSKRLVRDHRKVCVVDGRIAFCGGMNVSEDYAGERHGNGLFRDTHLCVVGEAARDLEALFQPSRPVLRPARPGLLVQVLDSHRWRKRRAIQRALRTTISRASLRVWLASPYFLPSKKLEQAIRRAARRGVDVRILTAGVSDVPLMRAVGRHVYGRYLRAGVHLYELRSQTLHAKTAVIDGIYGSVGSYNLDMLSDRYNHEVNVTMLDPKLGAELEQQFERDLAGAVEVTRESWAERGLSSRFLGWLGYQLCRLF